MDDQTGRNLQGYEIFNRIGSGGFGVVYRAYQSTLGREVALKIILPGYANRPEFIRRFEVEAQFIARLEHLHIVPLYDFWRDPGGAYLVTRLLKGGNLKQALTGGAFDLKSTALFLDQVASALSYAHANSVIHKDVKPANILLDEEGNCYLTDFGIALEVHRKEELRASKEADPYYQECISPEQARNEPVSPQSDIYSLGLVLYEILAGQPPFANTSPVERLFKHLNDPLPQIDALHPEIGAGVNAVIQKATAKDPKHRYQDALELAAAFRQAAKLSDGQPVSVFEDLTLREQDILERIVAGQTNREIAQELFIELSTVKWYVRKIYRKLDVRSRRQAVVLAKESGLFSTEEQPKSVADQQQGSPPAALTAPSNPYKGLRAFETADAREFFGREALVEKLLSRLAQTWKRNVPSGNARFLAVVGPSGSGKSSLIKAGLIPALMAGDVNSSERWFIAQIEPGAHPLDQLEVALVRLAAEQAGNLRAQLERDQFGLVRAASLILPQDGSELVLVIDQFEELFTLTQQEPDRVHYLDLLSAAALEPNSRVRVVIALRADFYDRPLVYPVFGELVRNCLETVLPLSAEELERAILQPAEQCGVSFEPGLVARIIEDVFYQPGALPMLQYALTELFEQREGPLLTQSAYQKIGGTGGALAQRAEELYLEMDEGGRKAIQQIFLRLVNFNDDGVLQQAVFTRRRAHRAELLGLADEELIDEILDTYSRYRLLSLDHEPATRRPTVEVAHEALLSKWERLQRLLDESREDLYTQRRLSALASEWEQAGRNPGYLLRSSRLDQFAGWAANTGLALTEVERSLLETSLLEREARQAEEKSRQRRELETARQLAETEARRAQEQVRTSRRLRWLVVGMAVFLIVAVGAAWYAVNQQRLAQENEASAEQNAVLADRNAATAVAARGEAEQLADLRSREAQVNQSLALAAQSQLALQADNLDLALALAWEAVRIPDPPGQVQLALSEAAYAPGTIRIFRGHAAPVRSVAVNPDGRYGLSGDESGVIYLWDLESGEALRQLKGHRDSVAGLVFTPDGRQAVSGSQDRTLVYWDLETGTSILSFPSLGDRINGVAISPDGSTIATATGRRFLHSPFSPIADNSVRLWDLQSGEELRRFDFFTDGVTGVKFTPDGQSLALSTVSDGFLLLDIETGKALVRRTPEENYHFQAQAVATSPDGKYAITSVESRILRWDLYTGEADYLSGGPNSTVFGLDISPDGKRALGSGITTIEYNLETREQIHHFNIATTTVAYRPDGHSALIGSVDGSLRLMALTSGAELELIPSITVNTDDVIGILDVVYEDESGDMVMSDAVNLTRWDPENHEQIWNTTSSNIFFGGIALSPDGKRILACDFGSISLWDASTGEMIRRLESDGDFPGHDENFRVSAVAFHPSGQFGLSGSQGEGTNLIYWDLESGEPVWLLYESKMDVLGVAISPDGRTALSAEVDGAVNWWDLETGKLLRRLVGHTNLAWSVAFVDNRTAISASEDGTMILWNLESGTPIHAFLGHSGGIKKVALSPDKHLAFSASRDGTAILWDVQTGEPLRRYTGHADEINTVAWAPDGREALSGGRENQVIRWRIDADLESFLKWIDSNRYVRPLTCDERAAFNVEPLCVDGALSDSGELESKPDTVVVTGAALLPPLPFPTPVPAGTSKAPSAVEEAGIAKWGINLGSLPLGGGQVWEYNGQAGERLSIHAAADYPADMVGDPERQRRDGLLDTTLMIYSPDGSLLAQADDLENGLTTDAYLESLTLPDTGLYRIEVRSYYGRTGGDYRLILADPRPLVFKTNLPVLAGLAIHPDGKTALVGVGHGTFYDSPVGTGNGIWVLDMRTGEILRKLEGHANTPIHIDISPDGRQALGADPLGLVILWDLETGTELRRFDNQGQTVTGVKFLPDGRTGLSSSTDRTLVLWDLVRGEAIRRFEGHSDWIWALAVAPDGKTSYSSSWDTTLRMWNVTTGELVTTYRPFADGFPVGLAVSPDGERLLVGREWWPHDPGVRYDAAILLLDTGTGETVLKLEGHTATVGALAFSPDGRYALSGSRDQTVRLWDVNTGEQLAIFHGHAGDAWRVAFSPDGLTGYSTGSDGSLRVWDLSEHINPSTTDPP